MARLAGKVTKLEKLVRSQATATLREMHDVETQLRGVGAQLSNVADAAGVRMLDLGEDGRAPSIHGRLDLFEQALGVAGEEAAGVKRSLAILQENESLVKMSCQELGKNDEF